MLDLTAPEIRALLWCCHVVDAGFGQDPPQGSVIDSARGKLADELANPGCRGQRGVTLYTGWPYSREDTATGDGGW